MNIAYAPGFIRSYKKLPQELKEDVKRVILLFQDDANHVVLRVHKLSGSLQGKHAFSLNYRDRIIFRFEKNGTATMLAIGDHDMYR